MEGAGVTPGVDAPTTSGVTPCDARNLGKSPGGYIGGYLVLAAFSASLGCNGQTVASYPMGGPTGGQSGVLDSSIVAPESRSSFANSCCAGCRCCRKGT